MGSGPSYSSAPCITHPIVLGTLDKFLENGYLICPRQAGLFSSETGPERALCTPSARGPFLSELGGTKPDALPQSSSYSYSWHWRHLLQTITCSYPS